MNINKYTQDCTNFFNIITSANEWSVLYNDFLISERMFQDYLDIFRGVNTRDPDFKMPYDHPFFDAEKPVFDFKPCVKYVLVAEARPPSNVPIWNNCIPLKGDLNNTYFYNIQHLKPTNYFNSLRIAFGLRKINFDCPVNKKKQLLEFAKKGVLMIDIFPFAIHYSSSLRVRLNITGVTQRYWNHKLNSYSVQNRLSSISNLFCNDWDLALIAPCKISSFIINNPLDFPAISINTIGLHPAKFRDVNIAKSTRCKDSKNFIKVVFAQQSPSANLIKIAFGL